MSNRGDFGLYRKLSKCEILIKKIYVATLAKKEFDACERKLRNSLRDFWGRRPSSSNTFKNYFSMNSLRNKEKNRSTRSLHVLVLK